MVQKGGTALGYEGLGLGLESSHAKIIENANTDLLVKGDQADLGCTHCNDSAGHRGTPHCVFNTTRLCYNSENIMLIIHRVKICTVNLSCCTIYFQLAIGVISDEYCFLTLLPSY